LAPPKIDIIVIAVNPVISPADCKPAERASSLDKISFNVENQKLIVTVFNGHDQFFSPVK